MQSQWSDSLAPMVDASSALLPTKLIVCLGIRNEVVSQIASGQEFAQNWLDNFIIPFVGGIRFRYITVGNDMIPGPEAQFVLPAMKNIYQALIASNLSNAIKVSTVVSMDVLGNSYPSSDGQFAQEIAEIMKDISIFVYDIGSPLMINVYPYFALVSDPVHISLDYALFRSNTAVVRDGNLQYYNLFDAMVDAFVAAMMRAMGKEDVKIVVSKTGWPTMGNEPYPSIENAQTYNNNVKKHVTYGGGTPRRPNLQLETYIFALFNENLKSNVVEQNFGTLYPNLTEVYPLWR